MDTKGLFQFKQMVFDRLDLNAIWKETVGTPDKSFSCMIYGESGNGKTTGILRFIMALCDCDLRATYVSLEEGHVATMQDAMHREGVFEKYNGRIILAANATFEEVLEYFGKRGSPEIAVIDSVDIWNMTKEQYLLMRKRLKNKIIILITWCKGRTPKTQASKDIEYLVDIKLLVKNFMIWPKSRFGGNTPQAIWEARARLLEQKYFERLDKIAEKVAKGLPAAKVASPAMQMLAFVDPVVAAICEEITENEPEQEGVAAHD